MENLETWELLQGWVAEAKNKTELLPQTEKTSAELLPALQITTKSTLGTILSQTAGVLVQDGWLRLFGGTRSDRCPPIWDWNLIAGFPQPIRYEPDALIIGYDMLGGFFALNGGGFSGPLGNVFYYTPEGLEWEDLEMGHTDFVYWCITGRVTDFYSLQRWAAWLELTSKSKANEAISLYPPLWSEQGKNVETVSKKIAPLSELWDFARDISKQL